MPDSNTEIEERWNADLEDLRKTREALSDLASASDWYRRCLEDEVDGRRAKDFEGARIRYDMAYDRALVVLSETSSRGRTAH